MRRIATLVTVFTLLLCGTSFAQAAASENDAQAAEAENEVEQSYLLGPEDVIGVFVWKEPDLSTTVMVRPDGKISLPLVNELRAAGKSPAEIRDLVADALSRYIENPVVSVYVEEINNRKISVLGEVRLPGRYLMRQEFTVVDAIALAGGFTEFAKRDAVTIVRKGAGGVERISVDVHRLLTGAGRELPMLQANDTVYVQ